MRSYESNEVWLGRYRIVDLIGRGGMGRVFRARFEGTRGFTRTVALKLILPSLSHRSEIALLFEREAKNAVLLDHPNIVKTLELGEHGGELFIAMDFIDGIDLSWCIINRHSMKLDASMCAQIVYEIALALHYAHERVVTDRKQVPIFHCDISPQNIMIDIHGKVKLLDFGISRRIENIQHGIIRGHEFRMGKRTYMAPEVISHGEYSAMSDIYSTGVVLFELLTGRHPFLNTGKTSQEPVCHEHEVARSFRDLAIPDPLVCITLRTLASDPRARYQTASELAKDLEVFLRNSAFSPDSVRLWVEKVLALRSSAVMDPKDDTKSHDGTLSPCVIIESKRFTTASVSHPIGSDCGEIHRAAGDGYWLLPGASNTSPINDHATKTTIAPSLSVWRPWWSRLVAFIAFLQSSMHWWRAEPMVLMPVQPDSTKLGSPRCRGTPDFVPILNEHPRSRTRFGALRTRVTSPPPTGAMGLPQTQEQPPAPVATVNVGVPESGSSSAMPKHPPWLGRPF